MYPQLSLPVLAEQVGESWFDAYIKERFSARKGFSLLLILLDHPDNKDWLLLNIGLIANVNQTMPSATWLNSGGGSLH